MDREQPYHRLNLRRTLLDAAIGLVGEVGPLAFTLREVARRAGVSHNAPYRHFTSREELLGAVAGEGFEQLAVTLEAAIASGKTAREKLIECGVGYVRFALDWPQHFAVMFDLPAVVCAEPDRSWEQNRAFALLLECVHGARNTGDLPCEEEQILALTAWSLVHGIAKLAASRMLALSPEQALAFTRASAEFLFPRAAEEEKRPAEPAG